MYIQKIGIKNFRLLQAIELLLEQRTTTIVGRNNSGKTSLAELPPFIIGQLASLSS